jgi:hypothetical protein
MKKKPKAVTKERNEIEMQKRSNEIDLKEVGGKNGKKKSAEIESSYETVSDKEMK